MRGSSRPGRGRHSSLPPAGGTIRQSVASTLIGRLPSWRNGDPRPGDRRSGPRARPQPEQPGEGASNGALIRQLGSTRTRGGSCPRAGGAAAPPFAHRGDHLVSSTSAAERLDLSPGSRLQAVPGAPSLRAAPRAPLGGTEAAQELDQRRAWRWHGGGPSRGRGSWGPLPGHSRRCPRSAPRRRGCGGHCGRRSRRPRSPRRSRR